MQSAPDLPNKPRVLLVSKGIFRPGLMARVTLNSILFRDKLFRLSGVSTLEMLPDLLMEKIQAIVLYANPKVVSNEALEWLRDYVDQGGGILALCPALNALMNYPQFSEILGGRILNTGRLTRLTITPAIVDDPIFASQADFMIHDAGVTLGLDPSTTIHFYAKSNDKTVPYIWTHPSGNGRICGCAIGRTASGLRHPSSQSIIHQALEWCTGLSQYLIK